jgi:hypothetical protein
MTVTVSPVRAAEQISEPSTFPRFLGRFSGPIAPAQVSSLDFPVGPNRYEPGGIAVVYEGPNGEENQVIARVISPHGVLGREIAMAESGGVASVTSMALPKQRYYGKDHFVVVFYSELGEIIARGYYYDGSLSFVVPVPMARSGVLRGVGILNAIIEWFEWFFSPIEWNLFPSVAVNIANKSEFTVVWSSGDEARLPWRAFQQSRSGIAYCVYDQGQSKKVVDDVKFDGTTSQSNPRFNACVQIAEVPIEGFEAGSVFARVNQIDSGEIRMEVCSRFGTTIASYHVGFGDYPAIAAMKLLDVGGRPYIQTVVVWHDPRDGKINFIIIQTNPRSGDIGTGASGVIANSSESGRPAVAWLPISNRFVIVWEDSRGGISARVYHGVGDPATDEFTVYDASPAAAPSISGYVYGQDTFYVVWMADAPRWTIKGQAWQVVEI